MNEKEEEEEEEELLACIENQNIKYLQSGQISKYLFPMERKKAHQDKISHLIVRIFIMAITPENDILYLIQKRSKNKNSFPEYFTDSASGHVEYEPNLKLDGIKKNALRELEEEFGIPPKEVLKLKFYKLEVEKDNLTEENAYIFIGLVKSDIQLKPDPHELDPDHSKFYTDVELRKIIKGEKSIYYTNRIWKNLLNSDISTLFMEEESFIGKKEKSCDVGLFIGRFQPFHLGHLHVMEKILESCKSLKIGIGSSQLFNTKNDPFTSEERKQFISNSLEGINIKPNNFETLLIPDIYNSKKWVDHVVSIIEDFDLIFTNSSWVRELFNNKGYKVAEKFELEMDKYNATHIRNLIYSSNIEWEELVPKEVVKLIKKFNGINRIKELYKIE